MTLARPPPNAPNHQPSGFDGYGLCAFVLTVVGFGVYVFLAFAVLLWPGVSEWSSTRGIDVIIVGMLMPCFSRAVHWIAARQRDAARRTVNARSCDALELSVVILTVVSAAGFVAVLGAVKSNPEFALAVMLRPVDIAIVSLLTVILHDAMYSCAAHRREKRERCTDAVDDESLRA